MRFLLPILGLSASVYAQACTDNSVRSAASTILIIASGSYKRFISPAEMTAQYDELGMAMVD